MATIKKLCLKNLPPITVGNELNHGGYVLNRAVTSIIPYNVGKKDGSIDVFDTMAYAIYCESDLVATVYKEEVAMVMYEYNRKTNI